MGSLGAKQAGGGGKVNNGYMIDYNAIESTFKEGKYNKTNAVPIFARNRDGGFELRTAEGYGTKINGEVFYIQKRGSREWVVNYAGMAAGQSQNTIQKAKDELLTRVAPAIQNMTQEQRDYQKSAVSFLNVNGGKVTNKQMKEHNERARAGVISIPTTTYGRRKK